MPNLVCVFSQINDIKHVERNYHSVGWVMHQGWDLGVLMGGKNFSVGIFDGAQSTVRSSLQMFLATRPKWPPRTYKVKSL